MSTTAVTLLVVGAGLQLVGIVAVAWPDFIPWKKRLSAFLGRAYGGARTRVRRLMRRPPQSVIVQGTAASAVAVGGRTVGIKAPPAGATSAETVAFLVRRDREAQEAQSRLEHLIDDLDKEVDRRVAKLRQYLEREHARKLDEAMTRYRPVRILGTVLLAVGITFTVWASLI